MIENKTISDYPFSLRGLLLRFFLVFFLVVVSVFIFTVRETILNKEDFLQEDEHLWLTHIPNKKGMFVTSEISTYVTINSKGLHDFEYPYKKGDDKFRIVFVGDSILEAFQVPIKQNFVKLLEEKLNKGREKKKFELVNGGIRAYGTSLELLYLNSELLKYEPDLVILSFMPCSDVRDNSRELIKWRWDGRSRSYVAQNKPYFLLKDGKLKLYNYPVKITKNKSLSDEIANNTISAVRGFLGRKSQLYRYTVKVISNLYNAKEKKKTTHSDYYPEAYNIFRADDGVPDKWKEAWNVTFEVIKEIRRKVIAKKSKFLVLTMAGVENLPAFMGEAEDTYPLMKQYKFNSNQPTVTIERFLKKNNIPSFSAIHSLIRESSKKKLFYTKNKHLTAEGHKVVANSLFEFFKQNPSLLKKNPFK